MVAEASGCWARELSAVATAFPSASAGPMVPKPVVMPAMTIDATDNSHAIHIYLLLFSCSCFDTSCGLRLGLIRSRSGRDVNRCQDAENVGLHHAGEQA